MVTRDELARIMPQLPRREREIYLPHLHAALREFRINNRLREAAFLAQLAHESAELRHWEELVTGAAYEGRRDLGNTRAGDGVRFKGRGPLMITGRANYDKYGRMLGLNLVKSPELLLKPEHGFRAAGLYWHLHHLNDLADAGRFVTITERINGGTNGLADRQRYYRRALAVLDEDEGAITVVVNGRELVTAGIRRDSWVYVPLRETVEALGWTIVTARGDGALIQRDGQRRELPMLIERGTGYTPSPALSQALRLDKSWDEGSLTVTFRS